MWACDVLLKSFCFEIDIKKKKKVKNGIVLFLPHFLEDICGYFRLRANSDSGTSTADLMCVKSFMMPFPTCFLLSPKQRSLPYLCSSKTDKLRFWSSHHLLRQLCLQIVSLWGHTLCSLSPHPHIQMMIQSGVLGRGSMVHVPCGSQSTKCLQKQVVDAPRKGKMQAKPQRCPHLKNTGIWMPICKRSISLSDAVLSSTSSNVAFTNNSSCGKTNKITKH